MGKYILALDQGTTSSRAILFDSEQNILAIRQHELTQHYPHEGWVEQDPMEIWSTQYAAMLEVLSAADVSPADVAGIGITNQRETTILWDKNTGRPVHNAIVWQCRRTADIVDRLVQDGLSGHIRRTTGLVPDAYFSGTKIKWLLDHVEGAREKAKRGEILFGTVDSWLVWKLTGGKVHITGRDQCRTHDDLRHSPSGLGRYPAPRARYSPGDAAARVLLKRGVRFCCPAGRRYSDCRHCRRPAGGAVRSDLLCGGRCEKHLRHGLLSADEHRHNAPARAKTAC